MELIMCWLSRSRRLGPGSSVLRSTNGPGSNIDPWLGPDHGPAWWGTGSGYSGGRRHTGDGGDHSEARHGGGGGGVAGHREVCIRWLRYGGGGDRGDGGGRGRAGVGGRGTLLTHSYSMCFWQLFLEMLNVPTGLAKSVLKVSVSSLVRDKFVPELLSLATKLVDVLLQLGLHGQGPLALLLQPRRHGVHLALLVL